MGFLSDIQKKVSSGDSQSSQQSAPAQTKSTGSTGGMLSKISGSSSGNKTGTTGLFKKITNVTNPQPTAQNRQIGPNTASPSTTRGMLAQIDNIYQTDKNRANEMYAGLMAAWGDYNSDYSRPYSGVTNKSKAILDELGVDTSNINQDWYNQYSGYMEYLPRTAYTNNYATPTKKQLRDPRVKLGYAVYQFQLAEEQTTAAENEWADALKEMQYWLDCGLNLTDAGIVQKLNIAGNSKYKTLAKMDEARTGKQLM
jgi:hypothetical protein